MSTERNDIWKLAEAYLNGKLSGADINELDNRRLSDPEFASEFQDSINLLSAIKSSAEQKQVRTELKAANIELKQESGKGIKGKVVSLMHNHWRTATIAAAIALLTSLTTFWMVQHNNNKIASQYSLLKRDIEKYKRSQNKIDHQRHKGTECRACFIGKVFGYGVCPIQQRVFGDQLPRNRRC